MKKLLGLDKKTSVKLGIWLILLVLCGVFSAVVWNGANNTLHTLDTVSPNVLGDTPISLSPGSVLKQEFVIRGRIGGLWTHLHLDVSAAEDYQGSVSVRLLNRETGEELLTGEWSQSQLRETSTITLESPESFYMQSGKYFVIEITNHSDTDPVLLYCNQDLQTGRLQVDDVSQNGFLNFSVTRLDTYEPSILFYLALLAANAAVLIGGALVLFRNVQTHVLYLILAVGFGFVVLLAVTPMYGFDMRFHFDSAYVYSNELLGMEGTVETPSIADPDTTVLSYYRRAGDDYNCYAHYHFDFVSSNYTDTYQGLRHFRASEAEQELVLVETYQNNIGEAYLYIPQALGFAIARLLGLGFYPMLQLGRMFTYGVFVLLVFLAIRQTPFGKRLFLIVALTPATLVQTVSISRDGLILALAFYITTKVLAMAYAQEEPKKRDWVVLLAASMYLAPCKLAYVPVSFFWLLIVYRRYLRKGERDWKKSLWIVLLMTVPILLTFLLANLSRIFVLTQPGKKDIMGTTAYSVGYILQHPIQILYVVFNTLRSQTGTYLTNAIQLFEIGLGSDDGITLLVFFLIVLEIGSMERSRREIRPSERGIMFAVFALTAGFILLGSILWTPSTSDVVMGLQGRYLTPVLPLLCLTFFNNRVFHTPERSALIVNLGCCVFPAIALMNLYLWTVGKGSINFESIARFS